ncbi:MgtC/SapB family protein [Xenorhabdus bovienii]|uniref:Protein MgtC n=1 Tax=Xenorhabdus bovienii str. kraussei Becker Underwood TaxID=1398204 RepID=A0A077PZI6_XENBV|nr:MgtC/SapB family protein [Xenorhabdus bovienii]CDH25199.1 Protein MgtC [Xenorhabdus bovienii str. kraussei Becker Underwood]
MLLTPIAIHLLSAMFFGALIGAERQWRQRIAAQIVFGIGFLGAGVIMRQGMNIRGLNTAATLWCSAGIGVLCGLGQYWSASIATGIILCANILLREAAQRINTQPYQQALDLEQRYKIHIVCDIHDKILVRTLILQAINGLGVRLQSLSSADATQPDRLEVCAEILATPAEQKEIESIVCRVSLEKSVSSVNWKIATELPA